MGLNKKGFVIFYTLMLGIVVIILALAFAPIIKERVSSYFTDVGCYDGGVLNSSLSEYDQVACKAVDILYMPLFIGGLLLMGLGIIGAKLVLGGAIG